MSATFKLIDTKAFADLCKSVLKRQRALDSDLHKLAVSAIGYSIIHGDVQPANRLMEAMSRSTRRDAMVKFLEKHGQLAWSKQDNRFGFYKIDGIAFDGEELMELKWYEAKAENPIVSQYDLEEQFDKFMKRVDKMIKEARVEVKHAELYNFLSNASAEYHSARQVQKSETNE